MSDDDETLAGPCGVDEWRRLRAREELLADHAIRWRQRPWVDPAFVARWTPEHGHQTREHALALAALMLSMGRFSARYGARNTERRTMQDHRISHIEIYGPGHPARSRLRRAVRLARNLLARRCHVCEGVPMGWRAWVRCDAAPWELLAQSIRCPACGVLRTIPGSHEQRAAVWSVAADEVEWP